MNKKIILSWSAVAAWCSLIFYLSGVPHLQTELGVYDLILRKIAHVTEYAVLFLLTRRASARTFTGAAPARISAACIAFSVLYAASDEFHQSFVPGRGPSPFDVGIDAIGAVAGLAVYGYAKNRRRADGAPESLR